MSQPSHRMRTSQIKWYLVKASEEGEVFIFQRNAPLKNKQGEEFGKILNITASKSDMDDRKLKVFQSNIV